MRSVLCAGLLLAGLAPGPLSSQGGGETAPQAYVMTMGPGASVYERFGHNAIWIRDTATGLDLVYNYGTYDFREPGFLGRFIFGRPRYWLAVSSLDATLLTYAHYQRDVVVQELALSPGQRSELAIRLAENALPENRTYTYDYYLDNCSTRVRDILDVVLGGALRRAADGTPGEGTLRFHTQRSVSNDPAMYLGILAAMGPAVDRPLDQWGEMFLPAKVRDRVRELTVPDGNGGMVPLVIREDTLLAIGAFAVESTRPDWSGRLLLLSGLVGLAMLTGVARGGAGVAGRALTTLWLLASAVGGAVLLFLWLGTDHTFTARNWNLALLSPLGLALIPLVWRRGARRQTNRWDLIVPVAYLGLVAVGTVVILVGVQSSREVIALALLPSLAATVVAAVVSRRLAPALSTPR